MSGLCVYVLLFTLSNVLHTAAVFQFYIKSLVTISFVFGYITFPVLQTAIHWHQGHSYMNSLFTQYVWVKHNISFRDKCLKNIADGSQNVYRSALTPKPGPLGGSVREVNPPAGSHEKRPLLLKKKYVYVHIYICGYNVLSNLDLQVSLINPKNTTSSWLKYLGPGGGTLPALSSSIISSMSLGVRSSWERWKMDQ